MNAAIALSSALAYGLATLLVFLGDERPQRQRAALVLGLAGVVLHGVLHGQAHAVAGGLDVHFFAALSWVGLATALLTLAVSMVRPVIAVALVSFPLAGAFALLYFAFGEPEVSGAAADWRIGLHALLALLAYACLSIAALVAVMLWFQERALRLHRLHGWLRALPPLTMVEALLFRLAAGGFALLTLALVTGALFVENMFAQHLWHKSVLSMLAWVVLAALLFGRWRYGWRGRRAVRLALASMVLLLLAFFGSKFVLEIVLGQAA